ncbi:MULTISPECIES: ParB/RepB/Spo0J family partition protein [unclassified Streptomyces]|uniref:ParB/RepB/Spo0J family partition protein n=1 Tax=unclassified Streptomyces TaxID=2593676 RepID=UPI002DD80BC6|nr:MULTISPECIES: ParB/RepB/Spo0J family partition protein [unclassified Streptomyces]WSA93638.1 ParB/RepB/Spo0J family partition protein [Streptomyces sp. NBC_01795]WSB78010.1 ParB/RepB/Spo0J family partition protein [Streptomyces sp. NBC_01775]WSS13737.1 ParB/RepB/Spo0J family partition protein [Streptomyces sp. NBC_01186]WSS42560.1 ParB/RepB/Spo0J family partition protein [Streptomyces sp. NBC_01187]
MSERRRGLGRGLGALIPAAPSGTDTVEASEDERQSQGSTSPTAVPVFTPDAGSRGVAAAKVAGLTQAPNGDRRAVSRETEQGAGANGTAAGADTAGEDRAGAKSADGAGPGPDAAGDGAAVEEVAGAFFAEVPLDAVTPNPRQPREVFDEDALSELVTSIKEVGLLQPVVVRQIGPDSYELIMGERRWRACREAGLERIPAIVRATDDEKLLLDALLENLHRAQLNPLEEAAAYDQLLKDFNCTHDQLADRIGRSRPQVSNTLRLLRLSPSVQRRVAAGVLSAGHARALLSVEDGEEQDKLAHRIVAEGLSVRAVEEIVTLMGSTPKSTPKSKGPRAGARVSPALNHLAGRLSDRFETRVKVDLGQKKGKIVVEFASMDDLERILGQLAPGEGRVLEQKLTEDDADEES